MTDYIFEDGGATLIGVVDKKIEDAYIPNGVTKIARNAFSECHCLKNVHFPQELVEIGPRAFYRCYSLRYIQLPSKVKNIGTAAFMDCTSLGKIDLPVELDSISECAFKCCRSLEEVFMPSRLSSIGVQAFESCTALRYVHMPDRITIIRRGTFGKCHALSSIVIHSSVSVIENGAFAGCTSLQSVYFSDGLEEIGHGAFSHCTSLKSVKLPSGIKKIGNRAFDKDIIIETDYSNPMNKTEQVPIEELRLHNKTLEQSPEYQRIIPEVMKEVYTQFVNEQIEQLRSMVEDDLPWEVSEQERPSFLINEAQKLMPDNPERAANLFIQLGSCHRLWALQKRILKEKYGITWYTPAELNPEIKYD